MKITWKSQSIAFFAILLLVGAALGINALLGTTSCENTVFSKTLSPDNHYNAQYYERECGTTVGFNRQIKLIDSHSPWKSLEQGLQKLFPNIYDALYGLEGTVFTMDGQQPIYVHWVNDNTLVIAYPTSAKIYTQHKNWQTITILYKPQSK